jgi:peptidyl-prolyl cis-trans isomerase A (cyclophilin A)
MTADMKEKPVGAPIPLEARGGLINQRGTVAMARTSVPDSATAQFFINVNDNNFLDAANARDGHGYAVFGKVTAGMDVVDKIKGVPTASKGPHQNVPVDPVIIRKATLEN